MFAYNETSIRRVLPPWGMEVKKKLLDKSMNQKDLINELQRLGFVVDKSALSNLLYGIGVSKRMDVIRAINLILEIPQSR